MTSDFKAPARRLYCFLNIRQNIFYLSLFNLVWQLWLAISNFPHINFGALIPDDIARMSAGVHISFIIHKRSLTRARLVSFFCASSFVH